MVRLIDAVLGHIHLNHIANLDVVGHRADRPLVGLEDLEGHLGRCATKARRASAAGRKALIGVSASTWPSRGMIGPWAERL